MRSTLKQRLAVVESKSTDWVSRLPVIDYGVLNDNYEDEEKWEEVHYDTTCTVYRNRESGDVRGVYRDLRTDEEIRSEGGLLEYL